MSLQKLDRIAKVPSRMQESSETHDCRKTAGELLKVFAYQAARTSDLPDFLESAHLAGHCFPRRLIVVGGKGISIEGGFNIPQTVVGLARKQ